MIGVVAHQRRQIERHGEPGLALRQQISESLVGILSCAEAGKLSHGPQPPAIHRGVNAARIGRLAGLAEIALSVPASEIVCSIKLPDRIAGYGGEAPRARRKTQRLDFSR